MMARLASLAAVLSTVSAASGAQVVSERGTASAPFTGPAVCGTPKGIGKDKRPLPECLQPTPSELRTLQRCAALNALERFAARDGEATTRAFERVRDSIHARFDQIVVGVLELSREIDSTSRQVTSNVRADINESKLRDLLRATSAVAGTPSAEKALMGMFMLARSQVSTERFDGERRTNASSSSSNRSQQNTDSSRKVRESESITSSVVTLGDRVLAGGQAASITESSTSAISTGSTTNRGDRSAFAVAPAQDLESVIGSRLNVAGYEPVEGALLDDDMSPALLDLVRADFGSGDDLKAATLRRMLAAAQKQEVRYVLVGFVEAGLASTDKVSGNQRVDAKVSAKVYDLSGRLPRTVVTVGPTIYSGLGSDDNVARTNAIKSAADETARTVINQLSNRQVR